MKESYIKLIFNHLLSNKGITPAYAFNQFGCLRLADVIFRLKHEYNVPVETHIVEIDRKRFARYTLTRGFIVNYFRVLKK